LASETLARGADEKQGGSFCCYSSLALITYLTGCTVSHGGWGAYMLYRCNLFTATQITLFAKSAALGQFVGRNPPQSWGLFP